jgi:NAD(P)-dependent dehydrogenase (short-subunit alcohol dehydrogenase family)
MRLKDKIAVITGGASGIGRATSQLFASEGARVLIGDLTDALPVTRDIERAGGVAAFRKIDVRVEEQIKALIDEAVNRWGGVDIVFNNAGISMPKPISDVSSDDFDRLFAVNVKGVYFGCKFALPHLIKRGGGAIVNMASSGGLLPRASDPVYSASKHAVIGLTQALAVSYAHLNVRVNALCPGPIDTPMLWGGAATEEERRVKLPAVLATCPAARYASADEVARAALFLASDDCPFISGVGLAIDGAKAAGIMPIDRYRLDFSLNLR